MIGSPAGLFRRIVVLIVARCAVVAAVLLLAGCRGASIGTDGAEGAPGANGRPGAHAVGENGASGDSGASGPGDSDSAAVSGSGHLTDRRLTLTGVTTLAAGATFVVHVKIGTPEQATIRMDDNVTELVDATVRGNRLRLGLKPGASVRDVTLQADVTVRKLDRLTVDGAAQVVLDSAPSGPELHIDTDGTSQATGPVSVDHLDASASGASTLALSGRADRLDLSAAGTSSLPLPDLTVRDLTAALSGASHAVVTVHGTLAAQADGASTLRYHGTPQVTRRQTSGVASITGP